MKMYGFKAPVHSQYSTRPTFALQRRRLPFIGTMAAGGRDQLYEQRRPRYSRVTGKPLLASLPLYPLDMSPLLALAEGHLDRQGVLCYAGSAISGGTIYHPSNIAQFALAHWNAYLFNGKESHREIFLQQMNWLLAHEVRLSGDAGVWPVPFAVPEYYAPGAWASAAGQGCVLSALIRAYQLTCHEVFLQAARRAVGAFRLDILDGGITAPIGEDGLFFEEVAVYPAAHILNGCFLALFGLYDYVGVTQDGRIEVLIERCLATLHMLLDCFDTGYWSRYNLLHGHLASEFYHALHVTLLEILAQYSGCDHCLQLAARWEGYIHNPFCYLRYRLVSRVALWWDERCKPWLRARLFGRREAVSSCSRRRVCVPLPSLPDADRIRGTLVMVGRAMERQWQISYLVQHDATTSPAPQGAKRGSIRMHPWRFPGILLYCWHGGLHLFRLLRQGESYHLLLPQDGIVCAAFAGLLGRLVGIRVVCMDSGSLLWPNRQEDRQQRSALFYRSSLRLLAAIAARCCDQFLLASDEVAEIYRVHLKVRPDRIMRSVLLVDVERFASAEKGKKLRLRLGCGFAPDAILIALAHRPTLEGEVGVALEGIVLALKSLPQAIRARVRVLIAEKREAQTQVRQAIIRYRLQDICCLWGDASAEEVGKLLNMADIFLSVGTRQADDMITVLEAMAASCAVIATRTSRSHAQLLTEGRGISVLPDSATEIGIALADLCKDPDLCRHMGRKAREYVAHHHSMQMLQRSLLRSSFFAPMHSG